MKGVVRYIFGGVFLTIPFVIYDLGVTFVGLSQTEETFQMFMNSSNSWIFGFYRVKATFTEPSYFGIYLSTLLYILIDINIKRKILWSGLIIFLILCTVSFTAYVLSLFVLLVYTRKTTLKSVKVYALLAIILLALPSVYEVVIFRLERTLSSVATASLYGSEGMRANSLPVMFDYFAQADFRQFIMGEGYTYYDAWLIDAFQMFDPARMGFARGQIFNAFAVVGISGGVIGLLLYVMSFWGFAASRFFTRQDVLLHFLIQFSLAFIVGYLFWGVLLMMRIKNHVISFQSELKKVDV